MSEEVEKLVKQLARIGSDREEGPVIRSVAKQAADALKQAEEREDALDNALAALHAEIARLQGERDKAIAQVRVAYGFDRDAVFANIDALTAQVAALRKALELYEAELRDVAEVIGERMNGDTHSDDANWSIELSAGHWRCLEASMTTEIRLTIPANTTLHFSYREEDEPEPAQAPEPTEPAPQQAAE